MTITQPIPKSEQRAILMTAQQSTHLRFKDESVYRPILSVSLKEGRIRMQTPYTSTKHPEIANASAYLVVNTIERSGWVEFFKIEPMPIKDITAGGINFMFGYVSELHISIRGKLDELMKHSDKNLQDYKALEDYKNLVVSGVCIFDTNFFPAGLSDRDKVEWFKMEGCSDLLTALIVQLMFTLRSYATQPPLFDNSVQLGIARTHGSNLVELLEIVEAGFKDILDKVGT